MKHIKKYNEEFKKGDYVLLDLEKMNEYDKEDSGSAYYVKPPDPLAIIIGVYEREREPDDLKYSIEFYNHEITNIRSIEVIRLLTPEEIEEFKIKQTAYKYNL